MENLFTTLGVCYPSEIGEGFGKTYVTRFRRWHPLFIVLIICSLIILPVICMFTEDTVQDAYRSVFEAIIKGYV